MLHFPDTNVLLYSINRNPAAAVNRERAIALLARDDGGLSVQVLQEFYVQATRATRPRPLSHKAAVGLLTAWTRFWVQEITLSVLNSAFEIKAAHGSSYWDSAIIAAARALGCRELYSEEMNHGREVEETIIINPFRT